MTELKPCPFCGQIPIIEESARFPRYGKDEGERIKGYTVVCKNMDCILLNEDNWYRRSAKEASEAWNRRFEPENRPLTLGEVQECCEKGIGYMPLWVEFRNSPNVSRWMSINLPDILFSGETVSIYLKSIGDKYNVMWRCWHWKPMPEQMAAEKWEG